MGGAVAADLLSVIIPTFNRANMISWALDSVAKQTYRPIEIIVVDDGSVDHTCDVVDQWIQSYGSKALTLHYVRKENGGAGSARNIGLQVSRGEFIQFLDSDDFLIPEKTEAQVNALMSDPNAYFAWSASISVESESCDSSIARKSANRWSFDDAPAMTVPGSVVRGVFRRIACQRIGPWDEQLNSFEDWEYSVRYVALSARSLSSPDISYAIRHEGPRVHPWRHGVDRIIEDIELAGNSAGTATGNERPLAASTKIAQLYSFAMLKSVEHGHAEKVAELMVKLRGCLPLNSKVRLKNEAVYWLSRLFGATLSRKMLRFVNGR